VCVFILFHLLLLFFFAHHFNLDLGVHAVRLPLSLCTSEPVSLLLQGCCASGLQC
jgi:hypothetical protein